MDSGNRPAGENVVRCESVTDPPAAMLTFQLRPAPLSMSLAHAHVSGKSVMLLIADHTEL